ncbi:MAG: preprotein translocase subunit Sec61beta [Candidatus Micrarchaeota archaeon]|nr:preprotein translocase subunit Sec61beta [Candidatus Micrarchaeota archaeon]
MGKFSISTPPSSAGLMRFSDVSTGGIKVEPQHVLIAAVLIIVSIFLLHLILG